MQATQNASPQIFDKGSGLNDQVSVVKRQRGMTTFSLNLTASGEVYERRQGRDFEFYTPELCLYIGQLEWSDDASTEIAMFGSKIYDMGGTYTYLLSYGNRLIIQSQNGNYWNVTPGDDGLINPVGPIALPSAAPQTEDLYVADTQSLGFVGPTGGVTELLASQLYDGWYLEGVPAAVLTTNITTDLVFTYASGFALKIQDAFTNVWRFSMTNDGNLIVTTV